MQQMIRNADFAAKLALAYGDLLDGYRPVLNRVSIRVSGSGPEAALELRNTDTNRIERWRLNKMRVVPDQARQDAVVLARNDHDPARLILREAEALRVIFEACPKMPALGGPRRMLGRLLGLGAAAAASIAAILLVLVPFMANRGADLIPPEAETALGRTAFTQIYGETAEVCKNGAGQVALGTMQARLTEGIDLPYPLVIQVVNDPMINAFALPGGQIVVHRGLIDAAQGPDEVAAVIAHEIGHVAHRDGTRAMLRAMGSFGIAGLMFGDVLGASVVAGLTQQLISSSHSREAETRADLYAHARLEAVGLPPEALGDMFLRMREAGLDMEMGVFRHLSSHPELGDRIAAAAAAGSGGAGHRPALSGPEWQALRGICS